MHVLIQNGETENLIELFPETSEERQKIARLGPNYKEILMGARLDGSIVISCKKEK